MKGENYSFEYIRTAMKEQSQVAMEKKQKLMEERQKLVDEGKAMWIKEPILNGYKLIFKRL